MQCSGESELAPYGNLIPATASARKCPEVIMCAAWSSPYAATASGRKRQEVIRRDVRRLISLLTPGFAVPREAADRLPLAEEQLLVAAGAR
ncbi:hypothetical protein NDU88_001085 [Pleurodeles waltl]|uniref:Uncharacterized protein n=1 Tax=Pleurodeles waltl TaxID=8319 RepID=A0AAV7NCG6_PLEWA|nr:hypothetical protein NDU88_001085 [Pleurodeles waltl]